MEIHIVPDIHVAQKDVPPPTFPGSKVLVVMGDFLEHQPVVPAREYRKVFRKMTDKLMGRRRGYTPPAWWRTLLYGMYKPNLDVQYLGTNGRILPILEDPEPALQAGKRLSDMETFDRAFPSPVVLQPADPAPLKPLTRKQRKARDFAFNYGSKHVDCDCLDCLPPNY